MKAITSISLCVAICVVLIPLFGLCLPTQFESNDYHVKNVDAPSKQTDCGYKSCHAVKEGAVNVHLIPHTHDDVGWLKTVDQYYYGSHTLIQKAGVQYILDSVIRELLHDPNKRFVYVETAFLWKWWKEQHDTVRHQVKKLVNSGQLEIIGGAWSMNDEAVTHYHSIIDQFTWGFRKLNDTFGSCGRPHVGWQIDPFGHSREMASLFAQMGFDGLFFGRLDYEDKRHRLGSKTAEILWEGSPNLGKSADLFTSVLYNNYGPPPGFCFDVLCADEPIIDNKHSPDYNVPRKVKQFLDYAKLQATSYSTSNIIMTMGEDFNYQDANMWYKNLDKLIRYVNEEQTNGSQVNVFYSTPSCYLKAVNDADLTWPTKQDDFFPYASDPHAYWTGYFTSRPTLKYFERQGNNFLQVCKHLYALADLGPEDKVDLNNLREAMGIMQHHDAVTGTEKQAVANDYARILTEGFKECDIITETAINKIISSKINETSNEAPTVHLQSCLLLNVSQCELSENLSRFVVTVYNPLSRPVSHYVRLPVTGAAYSVKQPDGKELAVQLVPIPEPVIGMPGRMSPTTNELVFWAQDLPPLGFRSYYISKSNSSRNNRLQDVDSNVDVTLSNKKLQIVIDGQNGLIKSFRNNGKDIPLKQNFYYYVGASGNNAEFLNRSSGAYIFRPNGSEPLVIATRPSTKVYKGDLVEEIHQTFTTWVSQVIRLYKEENHAEIEWLVGPIPVEDKVGKEVITRFSTNLANNGTFYTDSNGRELLKRVRNYRPTWPIKVSEPVAGNYYPITSRILIQDSSQNMEFAVLTDRSQGGSSIADGEIELMVHRRLLHDDAFGVGEALNETAFGHGLIARGRHYLIGGNIKSNETGSSLAAEERELVQRKLLLPWVFLSSAEDLPFKKWSSTYKMEFSGLTQALPPNVHILTLEPWKGKTFLLRLEHIMEKYEDAKLSKSVIVNLKTLFVPFSIVSAKETTLGGNQWLSDSERLIWKTDSNEIHIDHSTKPDRNHAAKSLTVTLKPMQIRTFIIEIAQG